MSATASPKLDLLRAKLALAIGPVEINLAYNEVKAARPNALDEPWSNDMSGPHKHVVFNNKAFIVHEVANEQVASCVVRGCPPIDVGENIKLYLNDVWQLDVFQIMGFDMASIRYPLTGRDPMGSLYYLLIESVNEFILKKQVGKNGDKEDENLETGAGDVVMDEKGDEAKNQEGTEQESVDVNGQEELDGDEAMQGKKDDVKWISVEEENHGHAAQ